MRERVDSMPRQLSHQLKQKLLTLPTHGRHNFVWAACRDNIHSFVQILALRRPQQVTARLIADFIIKPHKLTYHCLLDGHLNDAALNGVVIYIDDDTLRPARSILAWDKSFLDSYAAAERNVKNFGATCHGVQQTLPVSGAVQSRAGWLGWSILFLDAVHQDWVSKLSNIDCLL